MILIHHQYQFIDVIQITMGTKIMGENIPMGNKLLNPILWTAAEKKTSIKMDVGGNAFHR
ncbi:MAG: hypothetical protein EKK39_03740 [Sphingobacteriales bacterium]|uniref:hypothetical protein n=1 Tax=Hydrotalea flava TaxID=714549 RepID=UPI0008358A28|nr:hypothetical protein [Hydrotalea flava]RTL54791.1 MAG: hypothetical protein EKK39_03740 [Sphingobacteriales bacterium]